ncbi:MAG: glycosyltransferase family 39 protein, partial [Planctomycetota bacterium]
MSAPHPSLPRPGAFALLAVLLTALGVLSTDVFRMEGLIANGASNMGGAQGYSVAHIYGEVYAYKPPLAYWLAKLSFAAFGAESGLALRAPFALCALALAAMVVVLLSCAGFARAGRWAGFATVSGFLLGSKLGMATFDVPLAAGLGLATTAATVNLYKQRPSAGLWCLAYAGLAFAFLTKGPIAFALFAPGLLFAVLRAGLVRTLFSAAHLMGVGLCLALCGAWMLCAWRAMGDSAFQQSTTEASLRLFDYRWASLLRQPLRPLQTLAFFLPWSLLLLRAPGLRSSADADAQTRLGRIAWPFLLGPCTFLFVIATFEPRYYLPLAAPIAVLAGLAIDRGLERGRPLPTPLARGLKILLGVLALALIGGAVQNRVPIGGWNRAALALAAAGAATLL